MEVSDDKYSMNEGTGLELATLSSTLKMGWGQRKVDRNTWKKNRWRVTVHSSLGINTFCYQPKCVCNV